jgi:hypothetical protein
MSRTTSALFLVMLTVLLAACGGDSPTDPDPDGRTVKDDPSFATDVMEIFARRGCTASTCHGGGQGGLTITSAATARANLVNVPSPTTGEVRVIPGNADDSYLVKKLEGRASAGERMPLGGNPLDQTDLQNIKNWINRGAQNN